MDIRYIRKNMEKQSSTDMMNILKDLVIKSDISTINNFSAVKQYSKGDKVYIKEGRKHKVYVCLVDKPTIGRIIDGEWRHYIESETVIEHHFDPMSVFEERLTVDRPGLFDYKLNFHQFKDKNTFVAAFNSIQPRLRYGIDFTLTSDGVVKFLKPMTVGEKVILEIRHFIGDLFNNLFREVYVEESYTPLGMVRAVPIRYHGYRESSKLEVFDKNGGLLEEGVDYELNRAYIILKKPLGPNETIHITMWNKVMIKPTSYDYVFDENNMIYRLGVNDEAQLTLTEIGDNAIGNPYIELISEDGTIYHCKPTTDKRLIIVPVEPDIILATDKNNYKLSVNNDGEIYLKQVDIDYHKDIFLVSLDNELFELVSTNGELEIKNVMDNNTLANTLNYKNIVADNGDFYELKIDNGVIGAYKKEIDYRDQTPVKYINLVSPNQTNFMFFATDDARLAVRPIYIVDNTSNIIKGDGDSLYYIGMTNEGELYSQEVRSAPFVAEHKKITDTNNNLYTLRVDEEGHIYTSYAYINNGESISITLDSDAKDEYILLLDEKLNLVTHDTKKSTILKDVRTGYEYALYIRNNEIVPVRVQTELVEKDYLSIVKDHKLYKLYIINGVITLENTDIILPEKEDVNIQMTNEAGNIKYNVSVKDNKLNIE